MWSFGVLCWEITSYARAPFGAVSTQDVMVFLMAGNRLTRPTDCPEVVYALLLDCWSLAPNQRPTFADIYTTVRKVMQDNVLLDCASLATTSIGGDSTGLLKPESIPNFIVRENDYAHPNGGLELSSAKHQQQEGDTPLFTPATMQSPFQAR